MCLENHWSTLKYDKQKFHIIASLTILILLQLRTGGSVTKILGVEQRFASAGAVVVGRQFWKPRVSKKNLGFFLNLTNSSGSEFKGIYISHCILLKNRPKISKIPG